ncbi:MAG: glycosyltransferase family 39 protein [Nitrospira sp.]|nr:glycosyltransferase family 39 protein [Nitrospira sp.]
MIQGREVTLDERWSPMVLLMLAGALGLLARAWVILHTPRQGYAVDDLFDALAWNLASKGWFTVDGVTPSAHVGPLYPALLAAFYMVVGHRPEWVPYLHVLLDIAASLCIYGVGARLFHPRIGALAAAAVFLYPTYWTYDPRIRSESFLTCLLSLWLWATVASRSSRRIAHFVGVGLLAGLAILCKPVTLLLAVALAGLVAFEAEPTRMKLVRASMYLLACLLMVLPWTVRNYRAFDAVIPVSAGVGAGFWMGSDPLSRGSWPMPAAMEAQIWDSAGITPLPYAHAMYEVSTDRLLREKGWARMTGDPFGYLWLTLTRVWDFWIGNSLYLVGSDQGFVQGVTGDADARGWFVALYSLAKRVLLIPGLVVASLWSAWVHRDRSRELMPLYVFPIGLMAGYVLFTVEAGRYALPVLPCLMVLSAALLARVVLPNVSLRRR